VPHFKFPEFVLKSRLTISSCSPTPLCPATFVQKEFVLLHIKNELPAAAKYTNSAAPFDHQRTAVITICLSQKLLSITQANQFLAAEQ
jgi:hypothetical protein